MLTSEDLRFFSVIARSTSLSAAARALNVTASTVTQRLQAIETKLKIRLVERGARSAMRLTDDGEYLAEKAVVILGEFDDVEETFATRKGIVTGTLRVLAPLGFGQTHIAPIIASFQMDNPNVSVELELSDNIRASYQKNWDVVIHIGELEDSMLNRIWLAPNRRFVCASPRYIAQFGSPANPAQLRNHVCIALQENAEDVTMWAFVSAETGEKTSIRIKPRLVSNDGITAKQWGIAGCGIIVRSEWDVAADIAAGRLVKVLPGFELPDADVVALTSSAAPSRSARALAFLRDLKEHFHAPHWRRV